MALVLRLGLSFRQAALYLPFKIAYRVSDRSIRVARSAPAPVIYAVTHRSRIDPALMLALLPEDTLHILDEASAKSAWLEPWRALARTIAFNTEHVFVSRRLVRLLKGNGRLAVYIPEAVEPDLRSFRLYRAIARIAVQADARIVPIFISGSRSLPFSLTAEKDAPRRWFPRLGVTALPGLTIPELVGLSGSPASSASNALFDRIAEARVEGMTGDRSLFEAVLGAVQRNGPDHPIVTDFAGEVLTYRRLLMGARIFAGRFIRMTAPGEAVGLMLPNANGFAVAFLGLMSAGRTAAIINYTAGEANVTSAVRTAIIRTIVSSRAFVEKAGLTEIVHAAEAGGARFVWMEDLRDGITRFDKLVAALCWRSPVARQIATSPAVIMFTSGSEGTPKAVVLSHRNLVANAMQVEARIAISPTDSLMNVLPAFHTFGLTGGLILPLLTGVKVLLYPSPLHYKIIPEVAARFRPTVLVGTDTFLAAYGAAAKDDDFASVRLAVAGAEAVRAQTRLTWQERFGVRIVEGFGLTEASPVVAVNTAIHGRDGSVGRPVPGLSMRFQAVDGITDGGRLWISGPNVMLGYMTADRPGVLQRLEGGWHDTGDIVAVDREGFLSLKGRAKRFAKIAGEMVSLGAIELMAQSLWPSDKHVAVAVPDKRKGEKVVLVTTSPEADVGALRMHGRETGGTELMIPHAVVVVPEIPLLGSGKTDHAQTRQLALARLKLPADGQPASAGGASALAASAVARRA